MVSHIDRHSANRVRAAGEDVARGDVVLGYAAIMDHVHVARELLHLACAADAEGAARGNVEPRTARGGEDRVGLGSPRGHVRGGEGQFGLSAFVGPFITWYLGVPLWQAFVMDLSLSFLHGLRIRL